MHTPPPSHGAPVPPELPDGVTWNDLTAYLAGDVSDSVGDAIERWGEVPEHRRWIDMLRTAWTTEILPAGWTPDVDAMRREVRGRIKQLPLEERSAKIPKIAGGHGRVLGPVSSMMRRMTWIAGLALVLVVSWVLVRYVPTRSALGETKTYTTGTGERATVTLSDGSHITLAPRTTVRFDVSERSRAVTIDGEAYFDVARATGAPFVVRAGMTSTRVLGTTFIVRHYRDDAHVRVAVVAGRVAVSGPARRRPVVTLDAGWMTDVTDSNATTAEMGDESRYTGWLGDRLVFHRAPTAEVLAALTRWYGYEFRIADSVLARQELTAVLSTTSSADALSTLKALLNADLVFQGDVVILTSHAAKHQAPKSAPRSEWRDFSPQHSEVGR